MKLATQVCQSGSWAKVLTRLPASHHLVTIRAVQATPVIRLAHRNRLNHHQAVAVTQVAQGAVAPVVEGLLAAASDRSHC